MLFRSAEEGAPQLELLADVRRRDGAAARGEAAKGAGEVELGGEDAGPEVVVGADGERGVGAAVDTEQGDEAVGRPEKGVGGGIVGDVLEDLLGDTSERSHLSAAADGGEGEDDGQVAQSLQCSPGLCAPQMQSPAEI